MIIVVSCLFAFSMIINHDNRTDFSFEFEIRTRNFCSYINLTLN